MKIHINLVHETREEFRKVLAEYIVEVAKTDRIKTVKYKLYKQEGYPTNCMTFIYDSREMKDEKTIKEYGLPSHTEIYLVLSKNHN